MINSEVGDTVPIVERDEWQPTEFDIKLREHYRQMKREKWLEKERTKDIEKPEYWFSDEFDLVQTSLPLKDFGSIFMSHEDDHEE